MHSDFRLVSATSRHIEAMAADASYRDDLLNRLEGVVITLPPLRDRPDDIPLLVEHFLKQAGIRAKFSEAAMQFLLRQPWPGNIRQLQNCVLAASAVAECDTVSIQDIESVLKRRRPPPPAEDGEIGNVAEVLKQTERAHMLKALSRTNGNASQAAQLIGVSKAAFSEKRKRYGI